MQMPNNPQELANLIDELMAGGSGDRKSVV